LLTVTVRYAGLTRNKAGLKEEKWRLEDDSSLEHLIDLIAKKYNWDQEEKKQNIIVYNHQGVSREEWAGYILRDQDLVQVLSPVAGG